MSNCTGVERKGFNYEKSGNPRGRNKPDVHIIDDRANTGRKSTRRFTNNPNSYVNTFIGRELDHDAFHAQVDEIRARRVALLPDKEREML